MSNVIVKSSIELGTTIVPWNEEEMNKLKKEKEIFLKEKESKEVDKEKITDKEEKADKIDKTDKKDISKNTKSKKVGEK